jgi:GntR family transcriptional regulator
MKIAINNKSSVPIYYQIYDQLKHLIAIGEINEGQKVPTIRELAVELEINPNTVAKAYYELQHENILDTVQGVGTYVKGAKGILKPREREEKLFEITRKYLDEVFRYSFTTEEILTIISNSLKERNKK